MKNFRLLKDVEFVFEDPTTLVVGRNDSGKTSLSEIIDRFLLKSRQKFEFEDFTIGSYDSFSAAFKQWLRDSDDKDVRLLVPSIELKLFIKYDLKSTELAVLDGFIIDLNPNCDEVHVVVRFALGDGKLPALFTNLSYDSQENLHQVLRERVPKCFETQVWTEDPNDPNNRRKLDLQSLHRLVKTSFIRAQRWLDDDTSKDVDALARILEKLFAAAKSSTVDHEQQNITDALEGAVHEIQQSIEGTFKEQLEKLIPTLNSFGYPGLDGPDLETETTLDVQRLLKNHTKIRHRSEGGITLPESYSGLGIRNLIFILLKIYSFFREFELNGTTSACHLVFIEEPEAHLHPQMQEVFIRQLPNIVQQLCTSEGAISQWPVHFLVSTHSSHIANSADFESIRYFQIATDTGYRYTKIKDLRHELNDKAIQEKITFLHQYLTLTRCDLFFADKILLVEGTSERLLLPAIIRKLEEEKSDARKLSEQYLTTLEVGGAHAHKFFELLDFLEIPSLIITDFDAVSEDRKACPVHKGETTSNACIKEWYNGEYCEPDVLLTKTEDSKVNGLRRIAFQVPESENSPCGRTFEDAFMLANPSKFNIQGDTPDEQAHHAWQQCSSIKKTEFALEYAINKTDWIPPKYILDGLRWLMRVRKSNSKVSLAQTDYIND